MKKNLKIVISFVCLMILVSCADTNHEGNIGEIEINPIENVKLVKEINGKYNIYFTEDNFKFSINGKEISKKLETDKEIYSGGGIIIAHFNSYA